MTRPNVRFAAVVAVATGLLLSAGAGLAVADDEKGHNGGSSSSNSHKDSDKSEKSDNKPNSASAGGGSNGQNSGNNGGNGSDKNKDSDKNSDKGKDNKPSSGSNSGGDSEDHSSHTASKTKPESTGNGDGGGNGNSNSGSSAGTNSGNSGGSHSDESDDDKDEGKSNGNSNSGSNAGGNAGGNGSYGEDSSQESTQAPSTPVATATEQPPASEAADSGAPAAVTSIPKNNDSLQPTVTPGVRPSATGQPSQAPAAASVTGTNGDAPASTGAPVSSYAPEPVPADSRGDVAALTSAQVWIAKVSDQFITSVAKALREVTLKDLALAALPGIAGLLFVFMTGIGLGHRQAKFGFIMQRTGALRFVAGGPLGVVRSGGFVSLRMNKRATRRAASASARPKLTLVENAA